VLPAETASTPIWLSILTIVGGAVGFAYTWFRDARARKWEKEDRDAKANGLTEQIEQTTKAAKEAYVEANAVNVKIADLHKEIKGITERGKETRIVLTDERKSP
jgi:hypothetical protein